MFDGFSTGLKVDKDVFIKNTVRVVNSDFSGAKNELDISEGIVKIE
jgi:hypothetical protein